MYEFPTPNPDPKPTHHWGLDKSPPKKDLERASSVSVYAGSESTQI